MTTDRKQEALRKVINHCQSIIDLENYPTDCEIELAEKLLSIIKNELKKSN